MNYAERSCERLRMCLQELRAAMGLSNAPLSHVSGISRELRALQSLI